MLLRHAAAAGVCHNTLRTHVAQALALLHLVPAAQAAACEGGTAPAGGARSARAQQPALAIGPADRGFMYDQAIWKGGRVLD